jgi:hypothetical protein
MWYNYLKRAIRCAIEAQDTMDKKAVREFRERYEAVAAIEAEEQRDSSLELRWQQLNSILQLANGLGLNPGDSTEEDIMVYQRWARLKAGLD